ncbi:hypothetical protein BH23DEI1_BH23DEI1_24240 [soil metagenome]
MVGVTGTLGLFSLVDLFQLLASATRTGRLGVQHPLGLARVYFDRGRVVHAEFGVAEGADAVYALFDDERGTFEFVNGLPAPRRSIETSTESLVLDALRRLDEERRDDEPVSFDGSREAGPFASYDARRDLPLGDDERRVAASVNGQWSVGRLASELRLPLHDVQRIIGRLMGVGALALRAKRPRTAQLVVRLDHGHVAVGSVGVDEGILANWASVHGSVVGEVAVRRADGTAFAVSVIGVSGGGPYLHVGRDTLLRISLRADDTVLVRPHTR